MKLQFTRIVCACVCLLSQAASAQGQDQSPVSPVLAIGSRVRITSNALEARPKGLVVALDKNVVTLVTDDRIPVTIPLTSITALETTLGRKRNWLMGAAIGSVVGLLAGYTVPVDPNDCSLYSSNLCSRGEAVRVVSVPFAVMGAGIGALIKSDRWSAVTLSAATPRARDGKPGFGLVAAVRF